VPRRPIIAAIATLLTAVVLSGCGASQADDSKSGGPWSYVSGNGKTVKLATTPKRIIANGASAAALMAYGINPVGIYADGPIKDDANLKNLDLSGITILSQTWGKIDVERAATLKPDLIVGDWWPAEKAYSGLEKGVEPESKKLADLAPVVGPAQGDSIVDLIKGYETLAKSLGADVDTGAAASAKAHFDKARDGFKKAVAAKKGLTVLAISPYEDTYAVAVPKYAPELLDFQRWGLDVIDPTKPDKGFPYWQSLSWEKADTYQPDLLLFDDRNYPKNYQDLTKQPIAESIKAFGAGAYTEWPAYWLHTYSDYAKQLTTLAAAITKANPDLT
jgi:iron complex transport system substrate-binding protein